MTATLVDHRASETSDGLAATARAFATYSLVPYLGILFCPGAMVVGTVGVWRSYRSPQTNATRAACYVSVMMGLVVLIAQLMLWWILYKVPGWALASVDH